MLQAEAPLILPQAYTLYLVRHATPDRSRFDLPYHTPPGPGLTEKGVIEARETGAFLREAGVVHFLASPLERTWRTAVIAAEVIDGERVGGETPAQVAVATNAVVDGSVAAFPAGGIVSDSPQTAALVGETVPAVLTAVPVEVNLDLAEHRPSENEVQVLERVLRAFDLASRLSAKRGPTALVSHGSPVLLLLKHLGLPAEIIERSRIYDGRNLIPPGGVWEICRDPEQVRLRLVFVPSGVRRPAVEPVWEDWVKK